MLELLPMPERGVKFPADELPKEKPAEEVPIVPSRLLRPPPPQMGSPLSESSESRAPQSAKENDDFDPFAPIVEECRFAFGDECEGKRGVEGAE